MGSYTRTQEVEHELGADGSFGLRLTSGSVELRAVEGTLARVRVEFAIRAASDADADEAFERARFTERMSPGELELREPPSDGASMSGIARFLGVSRPSVETRVVAELPAGSRIAFQGVSADLTASGFLAAQKYRTVSGDLVLTDVGGDIRIRGVSSDVSLRADAPIGLEANTVSGDLSIITPLFDELRVVTVSGDVELEGELAAGVEHRIETVSGDLMLGTSVGLALEVRGLSSDVDVSLPHRTEGSRDRRRYIVGDAAARLQFSSMSGDVSVHRPRRSAAPPAPPAAPAPGAPPAPPAPRLDDDEQLRVLRALERGEIDVDEAARRLGKGGAGA